MTPQDPRTGEATAVRARLISALPDGALLHIPDGVVKIDADGKIAWVGETVDYKGSAPVEDLRPMVLMPGLVDTHAHLPQMPINGLGGASAFLDWYEVSMKPAERLFSGPDLGPIATTYLSAFAAVGTTTVSLYSSVDAEATDAAFASAEAHGLRIIMGQCLMDQTRYDDAPEEGITERRLAESEALCRRWHGAADGRLLYAFTPRFTLSCSRKMLAESARLAKDLGAYWQTHVSEDPGEIAETHRQFPEAIDYLDVYDRAGGLGPKSIFAHGVHMTDRAIHRLIESGSHIAHCPSNIYGAGGILDLGRYLDMGVSIGLASDVAGGFDLSMFKAMEVGFLSQVARGKLTEERRLVKDPVHWLRLATLDGARVLGLADRIGSLEVGKDADLIAVDTDMLTVSPLWPVENPVTLLELMINRNRPDMVRGTWVRGRQVAGPGMFDRKH
jgi:guanine deaminase